MSPKKRNWIAPVVLIALFFYMAVRIFSMNTAQPKVEYRTIIDYFKNEQVAEYELDFGTGELTMQLNDEKKTTITYSVPNLSLFLQDAAAAAYRSAHGRLLVYPHEALWRRGQPHGLCQAEAQAAGSPQPCYL